MDEKINYQDLLLENESLRKELHRAIQTQNDLLIHKQQLDAILDNVPLDVSLKDRAGRYIRINKQFEKLYGVKNEDLIGLLPADVHDPKLAASSRDHDLSVINSGEAGWREEIAELGNESQSRTLLTIKFPVFDGDGAVDGLGAIVTDISGSVKTKEQLRKSNVLFSHAEAMGNMGYWCWDRKGDKLFSCSDQFAQIYDMTVPEALGFFISTDAEVDLIHPDDKELFRQAAYDSNGETKELDIEYRIITRLGNVRYLYVRSETVFDNDDTQSQSFGIVQDITEIRRVEKELRQSHSLFQQAEAMGNLGYWCWDRKGDKLFSCSNQFAQFFDMTVPEALKFFISSDAIVDLFHPEDKELYRQGSYFYDEVHKGIDSEYRIITRSGNTRHLRQRSEYVLDNDGEPSQLFGIVQDVTDEKETESVNEWFRSFSQS